MSSLLILLGGPTPQRDALATGRIGPPGHVVEKRSVGSVWPRVGQELESFVRANIRRREVPDERSGGQTHQRSGNHRAARANSGQAQTRLTGKKVPPSGLFLCQLVEGGTNLISGVRELAGVQANEFLFREGLGGTEVQVRGGWGGARGTKTGAQRRSSRFRMGG